MRMKSITRMHYKKVEGYWVRVQWKKVSHRKFFSDKSNGGRSNALKLAISWRDAIESQLGKPATDRIVNGASKFWYRDIGNGYDRIIVWHLPKPKQLKRYYFSVNKYGLRGAIRRAKLKHKQLIAGLAE